MLVTTMEGGGEVCGHLLWVRTESLGWWQYCGVFSCGSRECCALDDAAGEKNRGLGFMRGEVCPLLKDFRDLLRDRAGREVQEE